MFRFDGEVFLLGTAIAAPSHASRTTIKIATICASSQRASQMVSTAGGGRIVANRGPYSGTIRSCKGRVRRGLEDGGNMAPIPVTLGCAAACALLNNWLGMRIA